VREHVDVLGLRRLGAHDAELVAAFGDEERVVSRGRPDQAMAKVPARQHEEDVSVGLVG